MPLVSPSVRGPATVVWFRQDLRVHDNPALAAAVARGAPVVPIYILDEPGEGRWPMGAAARWWLHRSLAALDASLRERGSRLVLARGDSGVVLREIIKSTGADALYWNRRYEPAVVERDKHLKAGLEVEAVSFNASLLFEPHTIRNKAGAPFQVFTPFWRHCLDRTVDAPLKLAAREIPAPGCWPASCTLEALRLLPSVAWDKGMAATWTPGESGALARLKRFIAGPMTAYAEQRDRPDVDGSSTLSPHLHFGEIGPRQIWASVKALAKGNGVFPPGRGAQVFLQEVGWREFAYHLLYHFPATTVQPLRPDFADFPWRQDPKNLRAWQRGRTGYPIVDAGMRQLWATGWMQNRVRMIVASFLVKHLRVSWQQGADWFWDTLVDADLASNTLGWQWTAGCGADAAPYFRIFNPILQGRKFDPAGDYVRRWVPELAQVPTDLIHQPWTAPENVLAGAGVVLGRDYPQPVVDHGEARAAALNALKVMRARRD
jgi:deoxyribodipyrimidine photo-lyase